MLTTLAPGAEGTRCEQRDETIRIVEYSRFPRVAPRQQLRVGFTRDFSNSGMCLGVDQHERVGSLLRLCIRDIDGRLADAFVGRVVWTNSERDGRFWLGLELLTQALTWDAACCPRADDEGSGVAFSRLHA